LFALAASIAYGLSDFVGGLVVAPLSAVGAALLPVAVGVITGERPTTATWVGVIIAFPAIWLVARGTEHDEVLGEAKPDCLPRSQDALVVWRRALDSGCCSSRSARSLRKPDLRH
jgi:hypothetical protein